MAPSEVALAVYQVQAASDFFFVLQQFFLVNYFDPMNQGQGPYVFLAECDDVFCCLLFAFPVGERADLLESLPHFNVFKAILES